MPAAHLNYHHLQYFWAVASDGNLTRTAQRLRVAQSSLSAQIRALEAELDVVRAEDDVLKGKLAQRQTKTA